jgi:hemerythrin-like domain-containing protein
METIYTILKEEHDQLAELLQQAVADSSKVSFLNIKIRAEPHMIGEEKFLYPRLEEADELRDLIAKAYKEHNEAKALISEMEVMEEWDESWTSKLSELKQSIDHHVKEEENKVFEIARNVLSQQEAEKLAEQYVEFKRSYMNRVETGKLPV